MGTEQRSVKITAVEKALAQGGINGGAFFFLQLPHSGIEMDLPLIGTFPPEPALDAGVRPDIVVKRTASDIAGERDPELAAALATLTIHSE